MNFFFFFFKQTNKLNFFCFTWCSLPSTVPCVTSIIQFFSPRDEMPNSKMTIHSLHFFPLAPCRTYFFFVLPLTATSSLSINSLFSCVRTGGMRSWFSFLDGVQRGWFTALELSNWTKEKGLRFIFRIQGVSVLSLRFDIFHSEPKYVEVWIIRWIADGIISRSPWLGA